MDLKSGQKRVTSAFTSTLIMWAGYCGRISVVQVWFITWRVIRAHWNRVYWRIDFWNVDGFFFIISYTYYTMDYNSPVL